jgi:Rod binding domain-containing protein
MPDLTAKTAGTAAAAGKVSGEKTEKLAKDFESVFVYQLLTEMNKTIGEWGLEKEQTSEQVQSLFSMYMSQYISDNGGVGLWKDIKKSLDETANKNSSTGKVEVDI